MPGIEHVTSWLAVDMLKTRKIIIIIMSSELGLFVDLILSQSVVFGEVFQVFDVLFVFKKTLVLEF